MTFESYSGFLITFSFMQIVVFLAFSWAIQTNENYKRRVMLSSKNIMLYCHFPSFCLIQFSNIYCTAHYIVEQACYFINSVEKLSASIFYIAVGTLQYFAFLHFSKLVTILSRFPFDLIIKCSWIVYPCITSI